MKKIWVMVVGIACVLSTNVYAGWVSGGSGRYIGDENNPWFLKNTKRVDVCVIWDRDYFQTVDTNIDDLADRFLGAVGYWEREFKKSLWNYELGIATQKFIIAETVVLTQTKRHPPKSCMKRDITLQLGWLSKAQIGFFNDKMGGVDQYIAAAVRSIDYDTVNMRGKGFIYVKPDSGPLSFANSKYIQHPWEEGKGYLLDHVLRHELGHVFGVPHVAVPADNSVEQAPPIMVTNFMERILNKTQAPSFANDKMHHDFFGWSLISSRVLRHYCGSSSQKGWKVLFGNQDDCHKVQIGKSPKGSYRFEFYSAKNENSSFIMRGTMEFDQTRTNQHTWMWQPLMQLYLPEDQTVLPKIPDGLGSHPWRIGPAVRIENIVGRYISADGKTKSPMHVTLNPHGMGWGVDVYATELAGQFVSNVDHYR